MPPDVPVIEIRSLASPTGTDRPAVAFEVLMRPALEAHVVLADGTDHVVAPFLLADGDAAMAAGFTELKDGPLRRILVV